MFINVCITAPIKPSSVNIPADRVGTLIDLVLQTAANRTCLQTQLIHTADITVDDVTSIKCTMGPAL